MGVILFTTLTERGGQGGFRVYTELTKRGELRGKMHLKTHNWNLLSQNWTLKKKKKKKTSCFSFSIGNEIHTGKQKNMTSDF